MSSVTGRAFVTFADVTKVDDLAPKVGGRVDYRQTIKDFDLTVSGKATPTHTCPVSSACGVCVASVWRVFWWSKLSVRVACPARH